MSRDRREPEDPTFPPNAPRTTGNAVLDFLQQYQ